MAQPRTIDKLSYPPPRARKQELSQDTCFKSCPSNLTLTQDRNQMFQPIFARGPWPETFKTSFARTNQTANKRGRQKKCVKIFLKFTYLHKTQPGQKLLETSRIFFEGIYSSNVWVSRFGCRFEYFMVSRSYGLSKTDEALNLKR